MPDRNSGAKNVALIISIVIFIALIGAAILGGLNAANSWAATTEEAISERAENVNEGSGTQNASVPVEDRIVDDMDAVDEGAIPDQAADPGLAMEEPAPVQQSPVSNGGAAPAQSAPSGGGVGSGTSGAYYSYPGNVIVPSFNDGAAAWGSSCGIDTSNSGMGYIGIRATSKGSLKAQVSANGMSYNYVLPNNNTPIYVPVNMGSGAYNIRVMVNTSGNKYAQVFSHDANLSTNGIQPYLVPNQFVWYGAYSACVSKARELASGAQNQGDIVRNIYTWMSQNIRYDQGKAANAASMTDYIPNPDATLSSRTGICFDYASLAAAMFRSLGIPCKVMTGNVSPNNVYHAWNMIYINGSWQGVGIYVSPNNWSRMDITFAAGGATDFSGFHYSDRYTY